MSTQQFAKDQPVGFSNRIERVAVIGAGGRQGAQITEHLLKTGKHTITALTRIGSTSKLPDNIKAIAVDYEDEESLASALKDQQLLVITLAVNVDPEVHHRIVRAAGKAGIRYIIPNIYAANIVIENQGAVNDFLPAAPPINLIKEIERVGVSSWILLVGGVWFDYSLPSGESFMGFDIDNRKVTLFDDGEAKINTSTLSQFGRAAAAIASLKEFPNNEDDKSPTIAQFRNNPVYLSSFYVSQKDILRSIQRVTNTTDTDWEIKHESSADRIENGKAMGRSGNIMGLVQAYYSFIFSPEGQRLKTQDKLHNELLGLPEEELDAVVKDSPASRGTDKLNLQTSNFCYTMSFGFGVGDFIAVGELCWKIYSRVYKVSRDAPEELRALIQELGNLSNTMNLLNEELRDQEEWIKRAGERRLEYTCKVMGQVNATLQKMDRLADKYAELGKGDGLEGSRRSFRIQWNRVKFAFEVSSINELRAKLDELRSLMMSHRISPEGPLLNAPLGEEDRAELSAAFLRSAETGNRPWASIGIDDWLQAGKWWLLKARSQINHLVQGSGDEVHAYINLLKACWILTDIVSIHPQRTHLGASNDRRNDDIRNLSQIAKTSLQSFPTFDFQLGNIEDYTMNIWHQAPPSSTIAPHRQFSTGSDKSNWQTAGGEVLFQCFVEVESKTGNTETAPEECFLMLEVPQQGIYLNFVLQNFAGKDIHKLRDNDALQAILWSFKLFKLSFHPTSLSASIVHSVSVLANWPSQNWSCLLLPGYDIGFPARSDQVALLLRDIINALAKQGNQDKALSSEFLAKDCLSVLSPLETSAWKILCWHCEKFEDLKLLLEEFNLDEHFRDSLIQTAFLRLDRDYLNQLVQLWNFEEEWHPENIPLMMQAALSSKDVRYLEFLLETITASELSGYHNLISILVSRSYFDAIMRSVGPHPADAATTLAWFLDSMDEQRVNDFLYDIERLSGASQSKAIGQAGFSNFYTLFVDGCGHLIEGGCPNTLSLYLNSLEGLGIDFRVIERCQNSESSQLAILPALVSPDPTFLRILLERKVVIPDMQPFIMEYESRETHVKELVQYPPSSMPHWPLYCAVMLVCDVEVIQLLCQHGASLRQESNGIEDRENNAQGIVDYLSRLSSLEEARLEHMDALMFCHVLIHIGMDGFHSCSYMADDWRRAGDTPSTRAFENTWKRMKRLLYRDCLPLPQTSSDTDELE
ncbi:oxidoreductase like [Fusarium mundagurra]|uniref:Oxidoreductase like n=1 Tax=Fusarium mundagurra TaxID=1567541 RepID=A0A8H5Z831_9HYPO|nr:oxidoreductase like [Fusarium mundagurra]